jgi:hypothetical protein
MKKLALLMLLALLLALGACGSSPKTTQAITTNSNSFWEATFTGEPGDASELAASGLTFTTQFAVSDVLGTQEPLDIISLNFINAGSNSCFSIDRDTSNAGGQYQFNTSTSTNLVTGTLNLTVTSTTPAGNVLTLTSNQPSGFTGTSNGNINGTTGTLSDGVVVGTWTLTGSPSCGGTSGVTGTFLMCQGTDTCAPPAP